METKHPQPRPLAIAPASNETSSNSQGPDATSGTPTPAFPYTCVTCTRRKVKCDKTGPPCSTCRKGRLDCRYEAPAPRKRKRRSIEDIHAKLERYEGLLKQHGVLPREGETSPKDNGLSSASTAEPTPSSGNASLTAPADGSRTGKLLAGQGKSRYIDSTLWRNLRESELLHSSDEEDAEVDDAQPSTPYPVKLPADPLSASLFRVASQGQSLLDVHPTYDHAMKLWKIYSSHVEPIIKVFHAPTVLALVQRASSNPSSASKQVEALLFAIYHFACVAMSDAECFDLLASDRAHLQARYYGALTQALVNASFLRTTDVMVLHAYVLFLLSVRDKYDPHTFWVLTGVAVRIAQRMGLQRDGEELGMKPFDVEMRRRLFWQLIPLDGRAAQLSGTGVAIPYDTWDTKQPLNVNDEDLWPDMPSPPIERVGATDMIFCLTRTEVGKFHQKVKPLLGDWTRLSEAGNQSAAAMDDLDKAVTELEDVIERKYLRYCDPVKPIQMLAMLMGRGSPRAARLRMRLPSLRAGVPGHVSEAERREIWMLAEHMLDYDISAHTNPVLQKFSWHLHSVFQFDLLIWIMDELRRGSSAVTNPEETWSRIEQMYACHPQFLTQRQALHVALTKLTVKAWDQQPAAWRQPKDKNMRVEALIEKLRASILKRQTSRRPAQKLNNPWQVDEDGGLDDVPMPEPPDVPNNGGIFAGNMEDFNPDTIDWAFWDQLISDTSGLA